MVGVVGRIQIIFCRWTRYFNNGIRDGRKHWQVGPWPQFLQQQLVERYEKVAEK